MFKIEKMIKKYYKVFERCSILLSSLSILLFITYLLDMKLKFGISINLKELGIDFCLIGLVLGLLARNGKNKI